MVNRICRYPRQAMTDVLDGEPVSLPRRMSVALHSVFCPMCRRYRRSLEATREALEALGDASVAPSEDEQPR